MRPAVGGPGVGQVGPKSWRSGGGGQGIQGVEVGLTQIFGMAAGRLGDDASDMPAQLVGPNRVDQDRQAANQLNHVGQFGGQQRRIGDVPLAYLQVGTQ